MTRPSEAEAEFVAWLERELPAGTIIGDPSWWAFRILQNLRQTRALSTQPLPSAEPVAFPMEWSDPDSYLTQWRIAYERLVVKHEAARNNPEERMRALERKDRAFVEMLRLVSARTTPPLPSAEPKYAWVIVDSRYPAPDLRYYNGVGSNELGKGWTPNHMKAIRFCRNVDADAALMSLPHGWHLVGAVEQHGWSASTTPPAAAQDTGRLDWLEENGGRISGPADDSPRFVIWGDTDAQDVQGETLREAIDNAMSAARAAGGE